MATTKTIEIKVTGTDLVKTNKQVKDIETSAKRVNDELKKMGSIKTTNTGLTTNARNAEKVENSTREANEELRKMGSVNAKNKTIDDNVKDLKEVAKQSGKASTDIKKVGKADGKNESIHETNKLLKTTQKQAGLATKAIAGMGKAGSAIAGGMGGGATGTMDMGDAFFQISGFVNQAVTDFAELDATVREMTFQFDMMENGVEANSSSLDELADSAIFSELQLSALQMTAGLTSFSMQDTADALLELAKSGFEADEAVGILIPSMMLADMEGTNLATTIHGLTGTMNAFGMGLQSSDTAVEDFNNGLNVMVYTADATANSVNDLVYGMRYMAPVAQIVGMSFEECAMMVASLGQAGIEGSKGARVLASGMLRLVEPTDEVASEMEKLNIELFNAQGEFVGLVPFVEQLEVAFAGMTAEQKAMSMSTLFGVQSLKAFNAVLEFTYGGADTASESFALLGEELEKVANDSEYLTRKFFELNFGIPIEETEDYILALANLEYGTAIESTEEFIQTLTDLADEYKEAGKSQDEFFEDLNSHKTGLGQEKMMDDLANNNPAKYLELIREQVALLAVELGGDFTTILANLIENILPGFTKMLEEVDEALSNILEKMGVDTAKFGEYVLDEGVAIATLLILIAGGLTVLGLAFKFLIGPGLKGVLVLFGLSKVIGLMKEHPDQITEIAKAFVALGAGLAIFRTAGWGGVVMSFAIYQVLESLAKSDGEVTLAELAKGFLIISGALFIFKVAGRGGVVMSYLIGKAIMWMAEHGVTLEEFATKVVQFAKVWLTWSVIIGILKFVTEALELFIEILDGDFSRLGKILDRNHKDIKKKNKTFWTDILGGTKKGHDETNKATKDGYDKNADITEKGWKKILKSGAKGLIGVFSISAKVIAVLRFLGGAMDGILTRMGIDADANFEEIIGIFDESGTQILEAFAETAYLFWDLVTGDWAGAWSTFKGIVTEAVDGVMAKINDLMEFIGGIDLFQDGDFSIKNAGEGNTPGVDPTPDVMSFSSQKIQGVFIPPSIPPVTSAFGASMFGGNLAFAGATTSTNNDNRTSNIFHVNYNAEGKKDSEFTNLINRLKGNK